MTRAALILLALLLPSLRLAAQPADLVWTSPSADASGSMPCGGHDVGMNVWVEGGDILVYVARSGFFDENNTLLKAGRFRIRLTPGLDMGDGFRQTLHLNDGYVDITDGKRTVILWADVSRPVVYFDITAREAVTAECSYESWRYRDRPIRKVESQQCSYKFGPVPGLTTRADDIRPSAHSIVFLHHNPDSTVFDATVRQQQLDPVKSQLYDPISRKTFGGTMIAPGMNFARTSDGTYADTDYRAWTYRSDRPGHRFTVAVTLDSTVTTADALGGETAARKRSRRWWNEFWQRSFIEADGEAAEMARNYTLFRYLLGCNAYGEWPTKFNGGLFTFDPGLVDRKYPFTPDFRRWGGGTFTAQNQRLVYWPMLRSGDFDMMPSQFDFYLRILPTAELRTRRYWQHGGANFTEQIENFGLPEHDEYGRKRPEGYDPGMEYNAWLEYTWDTVLEFCQMILDSHDFGGADIRRYVPLITSSLDFFDAHYRMLAARRGRKQLAGDGHLVIYPGSGGETFKMAYNPSSTVSGLRRVTSSLIGYLTETRADTALIGRYRRLLATVPPTPTRWVDGHEVIAPAQVWERVNNIEPTMLYPVFPWREFGIGRDTTLALNTWRYDPYVKKFKGVTGWEQANIWAACLGLTEEAAALEREKMRSGSHRFPAFFGPGHDWTPDHNWGGSGMIGLQEMLLQESGDSIIILPAWPRRWNVRFRLHASRGRTVDVTLKDGKIVRKDIYTRRKK